MKENIKKSIIKLLEYIYCNSLHDLTNIELIDGLQDLDFLYHLSRLIRNNLSDVRVLNLHVRYYDIIRKYNLYKVNDVTFVNNINDILKEGFYMYSMDKDNLFKEKVLKCYEADNLFFNYFLIIKIFSNVKLNTFINTMTYDIIYQKLDLDMLRIVTSLYPN